MIEIDIPGHRLLQLHHMVLDYNGTLACDGELIEGVRPVLIRLAEKLDVHVLTADTFGKARQGLEGIPCTLSTISGDLQEQGKRRYIESLGCDETVCIGNGRNDHLMLKDSALGIAVILAEGASMETVAVADVVCTNIISALELLLHPLRLVATLRN